MMQIGVLTLMVLLGGMAGWFFHSNRMGTWGSASHAPTIEQIQQLASLTVLHIPVADVQVYTLTGYTGGIQAALVVKGDVEIATDLTAARLEMVDIDHRQAFLVLSPPVAIRPRVDHERTKIYKIDRSGLWQIIPGEAGERDLVNNAMQDAQRLIGNVGSQTDLIDQARSRTKEVITNFFRAIGWHLEIRWQDQRAATPTTLGSGSTG